MKLDVAGSVLATLGCTAAVFGFTQGPDRGWDSPYTIVSLIAAAALLIAFLFVERTAENPVRAGCSSLSPSPSACTCRI
ncbi:Putative transmembrane efflux protein [Mycobacteroides abscessus subsp. abscessus]|nr:Putative transmembrane efflux protein [Mycobacteroides abscessus subsp. abscessus]